MTPHLSNRFDWRNCSVSIGPSASRAPPFGRRSAAHTESPCLTIRRIVPIAVTAFVLMSTAVTPATDIQVTELFPINFPTTVVSGLVFYDGGMYAVGRGSLLIKYDPATGQQLEVVESIVPGPYIPHIHGMTLGEPGTFWMGDINVQELLKVRFDDYSIISVIAAPGPGPTYGLYFEDPPLWVGHHNSTGTPTPIHFIDPQTGQILGQIEFGAVDVHGLTWAGGYVWVLDDYTDLLHQLDYTGQLLDTFTMPDDYWGTLAYDGARFWSTNLSVFVHLVVPALPRPGDIDDDGDVDMTDRDLFVGVLLGTNTSPPHVARSDLNYDGAADAGDIPQFVGLLVG